MEAQLEEALNSAWVSRDVLDTWLCRLPYDVYKKNVQGVTVRFLTADVVYKVGRVHAVSPQQGDGTLIVDAGLGANEVVLPKNVSNSLFKKNEVRTWLATPISKSKGLIDKLKATAENIKEIKERIGSSKKERITDTPPGSARGVSSSARPHTVAAPTKTNLATTAKPASTNNPKLFPRALIIAADGYPSGHVPVSEIVNKALSKNGSSSMDLTGLSASASFSPLGRGVMPSLGVFSVSAEGSTTADIVSMLERESQGVCGAEKWIRDLMQICVDSWKGNDVAKDFGTRIMHLCSEAQRVLQQEPIALKVSSPICVFGDIHGNFADLYYFMQKLLVFGEISYTGTGFLFLGDYVDRGVYGLECTVYLLCLKLLAPKQVFLLRGNHESPEVNGDIKQYGELSFKHECQSKFPAREGEQVWETINKVFQCLPVVAVIDGKIFCAHGGIPRYEGGDDDRLQILQSSTFPRFATIQVQPSVAAQEAPFVQACRRMVEDLTWSDPADRSAPVDSNGFGHNPRGVGLKTFGSKAVDQFLDSNGFTHIFRAHQEKSSGLRICDNARVITIFSTSDYIGHQNGAGVVFVGHGSIRLVIKEAAG
eukprot:TRINITY_DN406_c2_g3_i1.p1 TRINITY_DN406_c2_g3~~TRINITY_DN406_c2_g3_i1.p1  ORF type:complete len:595 (+),score=74.89 TRINITY_DN406_c2_g3_i1:51-1835(+)